MRWLTYPLIGLLVGLAVGFGIAYLIWTFDGQPYAADRWSLVAAFLWSASGAAGLLTGIRVTEED